MTYARTVHAILPLPPSANRYWRTIVTRDRRAITFVSEEAKEYKRTVQEIAQQDVLIQADVEVILKIFRARRVGDLDNKLKCLLDALEGVVYVNDSQVVRLVVDRYDDKHRPRVEAQINALGLC